MNGKNYQIFFLSILKTILLPFQLMLFCFKLFTSFIKIYEEEKNYKKYLKFA